MQTKFLNDLSKASVIVVMTSLFNTVTKSKSPIPNPKIHTWQQLRNITLIRNLIEIVLIQDYSLLYNAALLLVLTRFCVGREANTVSSIVFQRSILVHCLFRLLRKDILTQEC